MMVLVQVVKVLVEATVRVLIKANKILVETLRVLVQAFNCVKPKDCWLWP
jgi:hypothetical protein